MTLRRLMIAVAMLLFGVAGFLALQSLLTVHDLGGGHHVPGPAQRPSLPSEPPPVVKPAGRMSMSIGASPTKSVPAATPARTAAPVESAPVPVSLRAKPAVRLGEQVTVAIEIPVRRTLGAVALTLNYDPRRLHLMSVSKGELLGNGKGDKPTVDEPGDGIAIIHASVKGTVPKAGPGTILTMTFETLQRGFTDVRAIDVDLGAVDATLITRQREMRSTIVVD